MEMFSGDAIMNFYYVYHVSIFNTMSGYLENKNYNLNLQPYTWLIRLWNGVVTIVKLKKNNKISGFRILKDPAVPVHASRWDTTFTTELYTMGAAKPSKRAFRLLHFNY